MIYEGFIGVLDESGGYRKISFRMFDRFSTFGGSNLLSQTGHLTVIVKFVMEKTTSCHLSFSCWHLVFR